MNLLWVQFAVSSFISASLAAWAWRIHKAELAYIKSRNENGVLEYETRYQIRLSLAMVVISSFFCIIGILESVAKHDPLLPWFLALPASVTPFFLPLIL